jgi:putative membrane protein
MVRFHAWLIPLLVTAGGVVDMSSRFTFSRPPLDDGMILGALAQLHAVEVECSDHALKRAMAMPVKTMAQRLREDHSTAQGDERELAERIRVPVSPRGSSAVEDSHRVVMADLEAMKGTEYDRAYVEHEIGIHQAALDALEKTWAPAAASPEVKALIARTRPMLKAHLELAKTTRQQLPKV